MQDFQTHFSFDNLVTVDPIRRIDGLALFYNNEFQVKILYSSNRKIDVEALYGVQSLSLSFNNMIRNTGLFEFPARGKNCLGKVDEAQ